jgi:tetratricopeptide (TPR) repeat protein
MKRAYTARDLSVVIKSWQRRFALQKGIAWALRGLAGGTGIAVALLVVARFVPWPGVMLWVVLSPVVSLVAGLTYGLARRPSMTETAICADRLTGLSDRLSTAWEFRGEDIPIACLQRENSLESLKGRKPSEVISLWPGLRAFAPVLASIVLAGLLVVLPNPMDEVIQEQQDFQGQLAQAVEEVSKAKDDLTNADSPLSAEERASLENALEKLEEALGNAEDTPEALKALSEAEEEIGLLEQQADQADTWQEIGDALSGSAATESLGQALASGDEAALSEAMTALSEQIKDMSPEELQALASALQQAANSAAGQDETIAGALRSAARAIASGEAGQGDLALENLHDALATLQNEAASQEALGQTLASLRNARSFVSGVSLAQAGQGSGEGNGGSGSGEGNGSGNGSGEGNGSGSGSGQGTGSGTGTGSGGGSGGSGAGNQPGAQQGDETGRLTTGGETVFVPGTGTDIPVEIQTGPGTGAAPGILRPYTEVIGEYAEQAAEHMERSAVPEGYQDLIRRYFSELEE